MAKKQFKAESKRLLDLMINSIYTHNEIFLREIISNASDAIDKLAYLSLTDDSVGLSRSDFAITITVDEKNKLLTISDNGIGMDKDEMETNLGTICKSGSFQFKEDMEKLDEVDIIGQFGVGFYSAFMVSDAVTVISKKFGSEEAWMWQSSGADGYTMTACEKEQPGTDVIMRLKEDTEEEKYSRFLQKFELQRLVKKYSDYIRYPIHMEMETTRVKEGTEDAEKPEYETVTEVKTLNSMVPLWQRNKKDVTEEEYENFYHEKFMDFEKPLATIHVNAEGTVSYKALLYIPGKAPFNYYSAEYQRGLQLYSSGVMIMENCEDLLPEYFGFVKGVVDSQDLSLNISREMLQHNRQLALISNNLEKKIKSELEKLRDQDREKYESFFQAFGLQLKYSLVKDFGANKQALQDLILFWSSKENKLITLKEYVQAMPEDQKFIYYATGESKTRLEHLPQLEQLKDKGYDVLYFTADVDEFIPKTLFTYEEKSFKNALIDDLGLETEEEKKQTEQKAQASKGTLDFVKETLGDLVKEVRLSATLRSHPVCMVPDTGVSFEMEKYFKKVNPEMATDSGRILELNAQHPVFQKLELAVAQDPERAKKYAKILYYQALLIADLPLENPTEYTDLVCELLQ